jgi:enoyl-[acyl-carrier protein] reductase I
MSLTQRVAQRLPGLAARSSSSTSRPRPTSRRCPSGCASTSTASTACCTPIGFAPPSALGSGLLDTPWEDVGTALQVSTWSFAALVAACLPVLADDASYVGLDFDARVAWPSYDWMGVAKAGLESACRYLARDLGPRGVRVNLVAAGSAQDDGREVGAGLRAVRGRVGRPRARWAGTSPTPSRSRAPASRCCRTGSPRRPARRSYVDGGFSAVGV